ncbi:MAG: hypothetical protein AAGF07_05045 [Patescibacteria group bacterium]
MYQPPKTHISYNDLKNLIIRLNKKGLLYSNDLLVFLDIDCTNSLPANVETIILDRAQAYLGKIPTANIIDFLYTYMLKIESSPAKQIIFLSMYLVAFNNYPEMISFQKLLAMSKVLDIYNKLHHSTLSLT